jgi:hypothetical protein
MRGALVDAIPNAGNAFRHQKTGRNILQPVLKLIE